MWNVLAGVRILDLSRVFAGPAATQVLGDLGADVIKVEEPGRGDEARYFGVTKEMLDRHPGVGPAGPSQGTDRAPSGGRERSERGGGFSPSFVALNRNKRSIAIDLGSPAGQRAILRMAKGCDIVVHNFRQGAMKKFGLAYPDLCKARPDIILCEFSSYGESGPLAHIGANDLALQAHSGLMSITGEADRPPVRCGTSIIDLHGSLALVIAMMAALMHRQHTGQGQVVDTSLLRSSAHLMNYFYGEYWAQGVIRKPMGTANHLSVPNQVFPTADGSVVIIAPSDEMWRRCAAALDAKRLDRPEWYTILDRQRHRADVISTLTNVTLGMTSDEVMERLGKAKVNVAKVNNIGQAADHPQLAAIDGIVEFDVGGQPVKAVASPFALQGVSVQPDRPPPKLAEHTDEVLAELGFARDEIAVLREEGAFGKEGARQPARAAFVNP